MPDGEIYNSHHICNIRTACNAYKALLPPLAGYPEHLVASTILWGGYTCTWLHIYTTRFLSSTHTPWRHRAADTREWSWYDPRYLLQILWRLLQYLPTVSAGLRVHLPGDFMICRGCYDHYYSIRPEIVTARGSGGGYYPGYYYWGFKFISMVFLVAAGAPGYSAAGFPID